VTISLIANGSFDANIGISSSGVRALLRTLSHNTVAQYNSAFDDFDESSVSSDAAGCGNYTKYEVLHGTTEYSEVNAFNGMEVMLGSRLL
jgi:hypothetical protein